MSLYEDIQEQVKTQPKKTTANQQSSSTQTAVPGFPLTVGRTTTGAPGTSANVSVQSSETSARLYFTIPQGRPGDTGAPGESGAGLNILGELDNVSELPTEAFQGDAYTIAGDLWVYTEDDGGAWNNAGPLTGPQGPQGPPGPAGANGVNGANGAPGAAATVDIGTVTTGAPGSNAAVTNSGNTSAAVFNFVIPSGLTGANGANGSAGAAATISVGTVTTGSPGSNATVTNSGNSSVAVFNFTIPAGATGATGNTGPSVWGGISGNIATQTDLMNTFVNASGDTMTGPITQANGAVFLQSAANASLSTGPAGGSFRFKAGFAGAAPLVLTNAANTDIMVIGETSTTTINKLILDNGAAGIGGGAIGMRNTTTYQFDIGIGSTGPTDPEAFLVNRHASGHIGFYTGSPGAVRGRVLATGPLQWYQNIEVNKTGVSDFLVNNNTLSGVVGSEGTQFYIGTRSNHQMTFYSNNTLRGAVTAAGALNWQSTVSAGASSNSYPIIGNWPGSSSYGGMWNNNMPSAAYMIINGGSLDASTYVSAASGGDVLLRANQNGTAGQLRVTTSGAIVSGTIQDQNGDVRNAFRLDALASFSLLVAHRGSYIIKTVNGNITGTIPANATTAIDQGATITFAVHPSNTGTMTIAPAGGVTLLRGGVSGSVILSPGQTMTVMKVDTNVWVA